MLPGCFYVIIYGVKTFCTNITVQTLLMQIRLSTNQIAAFAHLHKQNGVSMALFVCTNQKAGKGIT